MCNIKGKYTYFVMDSTSRHKEAIQFTHVTQIWGNTNGDKKYKDPHSSSYSTHFLKLLDYFNINHHR